MEFGIYKKFVLGFINCRGKENWDGNIYQIGNIIQGGNLYGLDFLIALEES